MNQNKSSQTGGRKKTWVFDPSTAESIAPIREQLTVVSAEDEFFKDNYADNTLAIVMDKVLDDLPKDISDAVRLVHLKGMSLRSAAKILGVDHKTIKARVTKGVDLMRKRLIDSVWIAEMLSGYIPRNKSVALPSGNKINEILKSLKENTDEQK